MKINLPKPNLKAVKPPAPKASRSLSVPRPVEDLYRDMRDRRLLLPALLLIAAIVAIPLVLSAKKEAPPAPLAFTPPKGAEAVAPAVLAEQPAGVRDYHERLDEHKSKNPFAQKFKAPPQPVADESDQGATPAKTGGAGPPDTGVAPPASDSQPPAGEGSDTPPVETKPDRVLLASRIDAFAGPRGDGRKIRNVEGGDFLPSRRRAPIVILLGVNDGLTEAKFIVLRDVTQTDGDGQCRPRRSNCEFLTLKAGEKQFFTFGPHDREYIVRVVDIYEAVVHREVLAK